MENREQDIYNQIKQQGFAILPPQMLARNDEKAEKKEAPKDKFFVQCQACGRMGTMSLDEMRKHYATHTQKKPTETKAPETAAVIEEKGSAPVFHTEKDRIWMADETGKVLAEIDFPEIAPGIVNIVHTEVDPSLGGQGIAGKLTQAAAEKLRTEGRKAVLTCSYAVKWFSKHPEFSDVLDDPEGEADKAAIFGGPACGLKPPAE